ncbi:ABC transporter ATP-binding protein [Pelagibius sp. CAU 1746]|uniref:ABC transporter ATP-binding protein n=1 Tax=Pelagibius sp. CAU 1746 TaxID=3140370 RepID=UPI00325ADF94
MKNIVTLAGATKTYGALTAVENVSLELRSGEVLALAGHNGAGKTTLVKLILGLIVPSAGQVRVFDGNPARAGASEARRRLGFLPENVAFHGAMTGWELLAFYARLKRCSLAQLDELLERVGLGEAAQRRVGTYSKGMRQRLGLAQALIGAPELLLLDEPTSGLDPASRADFYRAVDELRGDGVTVLISTHALAEIEDHADRIAVLHGGRLIALGGVAELRQAAALPIHLRFTVAPCSTGRLLERLGDQVEVVARGERLLEVACAPAAKARLLGNLGELWEVVEDVALEVPGLPAVYSRLVGKEEGQ